MFFCFSGRFNLLLLFLYYLLLSFNFLSINLHIGNIPTFFWYYPLCLRFIFLLNPRLIDHLLLLIRIYQPNNLFVLHLIQPKLFLLLFQYELLSLHFHLQLSSFFFKCLHFFVSLFFNHGLLGLYLL